jgi:cation diffusion facilitator CzcD-associated flavoprotein CzcO
MTRGGGDGSRTSPRVIVVGAGIAGICMTLQLLRRGFADVVVLEKASSIGGTWRDNHYPGSGCDVPSHLYSYSFEPNPDWSRAFSEQPEILRYLEGVVRKHGVLERVRFDTEVLSAEYDETRSLWKVTVSGGDTLEAEVLVSAVGQLNRPYLPAFPGLSEFSGPVFHSARWDHSVRLENRRVAIVGTGASAIQIVPRIAPLVSRLSVFQRSPGFVVPRNDRAYTAAERWLFRTLPRLRELHRQSIYWRLEKNFSVLREEGILTRLYTRVALKHLEDQVRDPGLRKQLTPDHRLGCKRILISDDYYPALTRPNVEVSTSPIVRFTKEGIETRDEGLRPIDAVVLATGFESTRFLSPIEVRGRGGVSLHEAWKDGASAYLGMLVPSFPGFFLLYGPNTNLGHNSIIFMIECQVRYVLRCLERWRSDRLVSIEVNGEAHRRYREELDSALERTVWATDCRSWYKDDGGRITNNWGSFTVSYERRTREPAWEDLSMVPAAARPPAVTERDPEATEALT